MRREKHTRLIALHYFRDVSSQFHIPLLLTAQKPCQTRHEHLSDADKVSS